MEPADANELIKRYQVLLSNLILRRAVEGPLPDHEEARLAQEQAGSLGPVGPSGDILGINTYLYRDSVVNKIKPSTKK